MFDSIPEQVKIWLYVKAMKEHSQTYYALTRFVYPLLGRLFWVSHRIRHPHHNMLWMSKWGDMRCETCDTLIWSRCLDSEGASGNIWIERMR